ncbi:MAG TPA: hypothetical protein PK783_05205, partial [Chitinophagales bacterium]|nr:hypothetical protein [Chitinophagales bacterium]
AIMMMFFYAQLDANYYFIAAIIAIGAVASSRLYLNAHTAKEINTGFIVGLIGQIIAVNFF